MGLFDDFFDTKMCDYNKTKINYTPTVKGFSSNHSTKKKIESRNTPEHESKLKEFATTVYINSVDWCCAFKGSHIYKKCMEELFNGMDERVGVPCSEYPASLIPDWGDYWYEARNHKNYTKAQLRRIEKEFDKGKTSEDLVCEMLDYTWFSMIPKKLLYEPLDDLLIYKLRVHYFKK